MNEENNTTTPSTPSTPPAPASDALASVQGQTETAKPSLPGYTGDTRGFILPERPERPTAAEQPQQPQPQLQLQPQPQPQPRVQPRQQPRASASPIRAYMDKKMQDERDRKEAARQQQQEQLTGQKTEDTAVDYVPEQYRSYNEDGTYDVPEGFVGHRLKTGSISDRTAAKIKNSEAREAKRRAIIDAYLPSLRRDKERFPNDDAIADASFEAIMESVGLNADEWEEQQWISQGLVPEKEVDLTKISDANQTIAGEANQERVRREGLEDHAELVRSVGINAPQGYLERLADYWTNPFGGTDFETATRRRLLAQAKNERHLEMLIDAELNRYTIGSARLRERQKELGRDIDRSMTDDLSWQYGLAYAFGNGFSEAMASVPDSLASLGSMGYIGLGKVIGYDTSMWDNFVAQRADEMASDMFHKGEMMDAYAMAAGDGFLADTMYRASETAGMLAFDAATTALVGRTKIVDGLSFLGRGTSRLGANTIRMTVDEVFGLGKGATDKFVSTVLKGSSGTARGSVAAARTIEAPTTVRTAVGNFFSKPRLGANTFVARVGGDAFAMSYDRQMERAAADGRELSPADVFKASRDAIANMAIATLIGKNIPGIKRFPSGSRGFANSGPFAPGTMAAAFDRAMGRTLAQGLRGGRDFVMFDIMMDAYAMTDSEDRADVLTKWFENTPDAMKHLFGSFLIGGLIGTAHLPSNWKIETKRWNEFKSGQEAWREWTNMNPAERRMLLDQRSHEFRLGIQEQMRLEKDFVHQNPKALDGISNEALAEMLFYGTNTIPDMGLMARDAPVEARFYVETSEVLDANTAARLVDSTGKIPVTRAMVLAEAQRRGLTADAAQFSDGKVDFLFETKPQMAARRTEHARNLQMQRQKAKFKPPSPKTIRSVSGVTNVDFGLFRDVYAAWGKVDFRKTLAQAVRNARLSGNATAARELRKPRNQWGSDAVRYFSRAQTEALAKARQTVVSSRTPFLNEFVSNIVRSNRDLAGWVVQEVHRGAELKGIISRRMAERLFPNLRRENNTVAFRTALAEAIATHHPGIVAQRMVRGPKLKPRTEVVRTSPEQAFQIDFATPAESSGTGGIGSAKLKSKLAEFAKSKGIDYTPPNDRAAFEETRREAEQRGVSPFEIDRQIGDYQGTKPEIGQEGIDREITRLENASAEADPIVGIKPEARPALAKALKWAKGFMRYTDVELPYEGVEHSALLSELSLAFEGLAGVAIVSRSNSTRGRTRVHLQNGVLFVEAGTPIHYAKAEGVRKLVASEVVSGRRDAPMDVGGDQWVRIGEFNAAEYLLNSTRSEAAIDAFIEIVEAQRSASDKPIPMSVEAIRQRRLEIAAMSPQQQVKFMMEILPLLSHEARADLIRNNPAVFLDIAINYEHGFRQVGFGRARDGGVLMSRRRLAELNFVRSLPDSAAAFRNDGSLNAKYVKFLNTIFDRAAVIGGNPEFVVNKARLERIRAGEAITNKETRQRREASGEPLVTPSEVAEKRNSSKQVELITADGINESVAIQMEKDNPGILDRIDNLDSHPMYGRGVPIVFEHNGITYEVNQTTKTGSKGQYLGPLTTVRIQDPGTVETRGNDAALTMTAEQREASDRVAYLVEKGKESTTVDITEAELAPPSEGKPPKPPKPPKPGEPAEPVGPEGDVDVSIKENESAVKSLMRRLFDPIQATALKFFQDPLNLAIASKSKRAVAAVGAMFLAESSAADKRNADLFAYNKARREVEKDPNSTILKDENAETLFKLLEEPIAPSEIDSHPLTRGLRPSEKEYLRTWKNIHEEHRKVIMEEKRRATRMAYEYGTIEQNVARIREVKPDWKVTVIPEPGSRRKRIIIETEKGRNNLTREELPEFMANELVPEDAGFRFSYVPHMFFGRYRGSIVVTDQNGVDVAVHKFGVGERNRRDLERAEILDYTENLLKELKAKHSGLTFRVNIKEAGAVAPQDAVYMPMRARRNLVNAIAAHTAGHRNEINAALSGKVTSKPVATPFLAALLKREGAENYSRDIHRIMEVAINNFHRNQMGKEIQEAITPLIEEMRSDPTEPKWMPEYLQDLANHTVFGTRNFERALAESTSPEMVRVSDSLLGGLRSFQFYRQLVRPAQHVINSTQALQIWSLIGTKEFKDAVAEYNSPAGQQFLKDWGFFDTNGYDSGKFGDSLTAGTAKGLALIHAVGTNATGGKWDANSERRNQNFSFFAMARHAKKNLNMSDKEAAQYGRIWGSLFTQYRFAKANDPVFLRGNTMKTLGQFKRFQIQTLGMALSLAMNAKSGDYVPGVGRSALARFMLLNTALGGVRGSLVGFGMIATGSAGLAAWSALKQMFDDEYLPSLPNNPFKSEAAAYQWLMNNVEGKIGEIPIAEIMMYGVGRTVGFDMSGNFSLTNLGPGGLGDYFLGPSIGMVHRVYQDAFEQRDALNRPASVRMIESVIDSGAATRSIKSAFEYLKFADRLSDMNPEEFEDTMLGLMSKGKRRSGTSEFIAPRGHMEFIAEILGFRPAAYGGLVSLAAVGKMVDETWSEARNRVAATYQTDPEKAFSMMQSWNDAYGTIAPMHFADIELMAGRARERVLYPRSTRDIRRRTDVAEAAIGEVQGTAKEQEKNESP